MNINLLGIFLAMSLCIGACSTEEVNIDCVEINYNQIFNLKANRIYCLPDGNEIRPESLNNAYCPCNAICIWQGETNINMTYNINGVEESYLFHEENVLNDTTIVIPSIVKFVLHKVYFEVECTEDLPSPNIESVDFEVTLQ